MANKKGISESSLTADRQQTTAELTAKYLQDLTQQFVKIKSALEDENYTFIKTQIHNIKGASGTYRLDAIYEKTLQMKQFVDNQSGEEILDTITQIENLIEEEIGRLNLAPKSADSRSQRTQISDSGPFILTVDDDTNLLDIIDNRLQKWGYAHRGVTNSAAMWEELERVIPSVILLDMKLGGDDGITLMPQLKQRFPSVPVIAITAYATIETAVKSIKNGAYDYVCKPLDFERLHIELNKAIEHNCLSLQVEDTLAKLSSQNAELEKRVQQRTAQITKTRDVTVFALAKLAESRDPETGKHLERLRAYSQMIAKQLAREGPYINEIDEQFLENIYRSSPLHDVGKVGIPDAVLLKPGQLSDDEFEIMKRHTLIGEKALKKASEHSESGDFLAMAVDIARYHHERFNGHGYPDGLAHQNIPLSARIVALTDVYDALTSVRVYKSALEPIVAKNMIEQEKGKHFDPAIVEAFCTCWDDFLNVHALVDGHVPELVETAASNDV